MRFLVLTAYISLTLFGAFCVAMGSMNSMETMSDHAMFVTECGFTCPLMAHEQMFTWFAMSRATLLPLLLLLAFTPFFVMKLREWILAPCELFHYHSPPDTKLFSFFTQLFSRGIIQPKLCESWT